MNFTIFSSTSSYDYSGDFTIQWDDTPSTKQKYFISPEKWTALFVYVIVFILGVPGNALVVWITLEMKKSVNTIWFVNLAIADLLCCLAVPFNIMEIVLGYWPLGLAACKLIPSILLINMYASVLLLTVISLDRWALVAKPIWSQNKRSVKKAYLACLVVWVLAFILTSPSFFFRKTDKGNRVNEACVLHFDFSAEYRLKIKKCIAIFRFLMGFIIPLIAIIICYSVLLKTVSERYIKSSKTVKVVAVVIIGFFVCWFPYHIAGLILNSASPRSDLYKSTIKADPFLISIAFVNSCINPIIYVLMGHDLKSKFKKSIQSVMRKVLADEQSDSFDSKKTKSSSETKNTNTYV
ncbi:hypothetical protein GDO86_015697 [Hymenochirus boettgeri]|uniref:G-protein coupled receptors family 1 profile domain-containing protein n=1 Tax=Hymenochirus boettgeri TaxID=247094 RepID=A0A8T2K250_9PIPI|nr:hypothetical protein GDO86_015697 [Hymenochirus boettgeri]